MGEKVRFFQVTLDHIGKTQENVNQIFAFWQENIAQFDSLLIEMMPKLVANVTESKDIREKELIFRKLLTFGNLMQHFPQGNRGINLELAIASYQSCASFFTLGGHPQWWAALQNSMGNAYWERTEGARRENIEQAIHAYQSSLKIYTHHEFPEEWAMVQFFLGLAYRCRIEGEQKENLEEAIDAYSASLKVYTRQNAPTQWAVIQNILGRTYQEQAAGRRTENLEQAIHAYRDALTVYTPHKFPNQWREVTHNLSAVQTELETLKRGHFLNIAAILFATIFLGYLGYVGYSNQFSLTPTAERFEYHDFPSPELKTIEPPQRWYCVTYCDGKMCSKPCEKEKK
jgi:tetratricopeptide (TPR) repeat protein